MKRSTSSILLLLPSAKSQPPPLQDPFLDNLVGDWRIERNMGKRGVKQTSVHCEWVLNHQFIKLHYGASNAKPKYEAFVFIGLDTAAKSYVCHWVDVFGATYSALGNGKLDLLSIEFRFCSKRQRPDQQIHFRSKNQDLDLAHSTG
jgi:hypothetical protein